MITQTGLIAVLAGALVASASAQTTADSAEPPQEFTDLIKIKSDLIGRWEGEAQVYDTNQAKYITVSFRRDVSQGPFPYTFVIDGYTEWEDGTRTPGYEIMGVRSDGAMVRQLLFQGDATAYKQEVVLDYAIESEDEWTLTFLETLEGGQGIDGPGTFEVHFEYSGDKWIVTRSLAFGAGTGREWEARAELYRKEIHAD